MPQGARSEEKGAGRGLRTTLLALGVALAAVSTAALVVTENPQMLRLAVLGALWAFVLAAIAVPRRSPRGAGYGNDGSPGAGREIELRRTYEIELEREVAARREYELQLEVHLRRELDTGLMEGVEALREEVAHLRGELIDRLNGELRMERIETTRLIGGSLRALQDQARALGLALPAPDAPGYPYDDVDVNGQGVPDAMPLPQLPAALAGSPAGPLPQPSQSEVLSYPGYPGQVDSPPPRYTPLPPPEPALPPSWAEPGSRQPWAEGGGSPPWAEPGPLLPPPAREPTRRVRHASDDRFRPAPEGDRGGGGGRHGHGEQQTGRHSGAAEPAGPQGDRGERGVATGWPPPPDDELSRILSGAVRPPAPRSAGPGEERSGRRRRYRDDGEPNEVMQRLLGDGSAGR